MWDVDECGAKSCSTRGPKSSCKRKNHRWVRHSPQSRSPGFGDTSESVVFLPDARPPTLARSVYKDVLRSKPGKLIKYRTISIAPLKTHLLIEKPP
jgi:hypothetical protein